MAEPGEAPKVRPGEAPTWVEEANLNQLLRGRSKFTTRGGAEGRPGDANNGDLSLHSF